MLALSNSRVLAKSRYSSLDPETFKFYRTAVGDVTEGVVFNPLALGDRCLCSRNGKEIYNPGQKGLGHFPLLSLFYVETVGNQQFTVIKIALKRFFPRSP